MRTRTWARRGAHRSCLTWIRPRTLRSLRSSCAQRRSLPFAREALAELEGRIDANAHLALPATGNAQMEGKVVFDHGKFELTSALGEFHDVCATLSLDPRWDRAARERERVWRHGQGGGGRDGAPRRPGSRSARANDRDPEQGTLPLTRRRHAARKHRRKPRDHGRRHGRPQGARRESSPFPRFTFCLPDSGSRSVQGTWGPSTAANIGVRRTMATTSNS
jgi:hypothetical protein